MGFLANLTGVAAATEELTKRTIAADAYGYVAARQATELVRAAMVARASGGPPGPNVDSGRLVDSIISEGPNRVGFGHYQSRIGPSGVEYARIVELGSAARGHRKHPYARPGLNDKRSEAARLWRDAMARAVGGR